MNPRTTATVLFLLIFSANEISCRNKRSIELNTAYSKIGDTKLPRHILPSAYLLELYPRPEEGYFTGRVTINLTWHEPTYKIVLHCDKLVKISNTITVFQTKPDDETAEKEGVERFDPPQKIEVVETRRDPENPIFTVLLAKSLKGGAQVVLDMNFTGPMQNETTEGLFRTSYVDQKSGESKWVIGTYFRPDLARKVFPCFDEPGYKSEFVVKIARKKPMIAVSNMPLERTVSFSDAEDDIGSNEESEEDENSGWVWDIFEKSPPMATCFLGFVISEFDCYLYTLPKPSKPSDLEIKVWARPDFITAIENVTDKVISALNVQEEFWGMEFPLPKLDIFAMPNFQSLRPSDSWGLILFKESELTGKVSWPIAHELAYQWLGGCVTPYWWSDAFTNHAMCRYATAYTTLKLYNGLESFNNWPMTMLYSIYYEFSKRYPHGKASAVKYDSVSAKTELVIRMLNYTLGEPAFKKGIHHFMYYRQYKTFFGDDLWTSITQAAWKEGTLDQKITVSDIVASWITKQRLPILNVTRHYGTTRAIATQSIYLRERPHDVPDKDTFLWWIPIVMVTQPRLNFRKTIPVKWMQKEREITLHGMPDDDQFVIINPEEIGPFPVNYDVRNWNMLASYLNSENRTQIPVNTRAKLLHDAWNLAYAGDLSFGTALNMTLFLSKERDYIAWDPVFTMIDHIGRHIDSSEVYKKFQTYVRLLLTPLYKELGDEPEDDESEGRAHLRSSSKVFLCQAGYKPCIEEAQQAFKKWMEAENPDEGNPVANQYICTVFKWGTKEEWEFGLQRVIKFPANRQQNERTYLLKTLAGCPVDAWKIQRLLNISVLEQNGNFSDNDVHLIFSMLTGGANGYTNLFKFLETHWDEIKIRFAQKPSLWHSLLTSATTVFKTQEGLEQVKRLYDDRRGTFGTGEFIVERAIKLIKEETKWSNENLPVIENWLDQFLKDKVI